MSYHSSLPPVGQTFDRNGQPSMPTSSSQPAGGPPLYAMQGPGTGQPYQNPYAAGPSAPYVPNGPQNAYELPTPTYQRIPKPQRIPPQQMPAAHYPAQASVVNHSQQTATSQYVNPLDLQGANLYPSQPQHHQAAPVRQQSPHTAAHLLPIPPSDLLQPPPASYHRPRQQRSPSQTQESLPQQQQPALPPQQPPAAVQRQQPAPQQRQHAPQQQHHPAPPQRQQQMSQSQSQPQPQPQPQQRALSASRPAPPGGGIQVNIPLAKTPVSLPPGRKPSSVGGVSIASPVSKSPVVSRSPALSRSPLLKNAGVAKSPKMSPKMSASHGFDQPSLLIHVADELLGKAQEGVLRLASSGSPDAIDEYHQLLATGLGCLEVAIASNRLPPRIEAKARLRYAGLVIEETENLMEAETMLTNGIALTEKHIMLDLKYCMQYLFLKVLFRRGPRAAMVALDKTIAECNTLNHLHWSYAFRFLKATLLFQSGHLSDLPAAIDVLKSIASLAARREDYAMFSFASLLEGLAHLKQDKPDVVTRVQDCLAQAAKYQTQSARVPQIDLLGLMLDLACAIRTKAPDPALVKMRSLSSRMEELCNESGWETSELLLPVRKHGVSSPTVSKDTRSIVRPGSSDQDHIVLNFMGKRIEMYSLSGTLCGLAMQYKPQPPGNLQMRNANDTRLWVEALETLAKVPLQKLPRELGMSLQQAMRLTKWAAELKIYVYVLLALNAGTRGEWAKVHFCLNQIKDLLDDSTMDKSLQDLVWYLRGAYFQGCADFPRALDIFSHERFALRPRPGGGSGADGGGGGALETTGEVAPLRAITILAALNRLWIMQNEAQRNDRVAMQLAEELSLVCPEHPDPDVKTTYHLVMASIATDPPMEIGPLKQHIQSALRNAQVSRNFPCLSIALNIMREKLFEGLVGEQALKSAKAASTQASLIGNLLWMSVADGMLAKSYALRGQFDDERRCEADAIRYANEAKARTKEPPASSL